MRKDNGGVLSVIREKEHFLNKVQEYTRMVLVGGGLEGGSLQAKSVEMSEIKQIG